MAIMCIYVLIIQYIFYRVYVFFYRCNVYASFDIIDIYLSDLISRDLINFTFRFIDFC